MEVRGRERGRLRDALNGWDALLDLLCVQPLNDDWQIVKLRKNSNTSKEMLLWNLMVSVLLQRLFYNFLKSKTPRISDKQVTQVTPP
jgi:hypothetical protein